MSQSLRCPVSLWCLNIILKLFITKIEKIKIDLSKNVKGLTKNENGISKNERLLSARVQIKQTNINVTKKVNQL